MEYYVKGKKYKKILVNSIDKKLYVNCRKIPEFVYSLNDVRLWFDRKHDIEFDYLSISRISARKDSKNIYDLNITHCNQGILMLPDFSNLNVYKRSKTFLSTMIDEFNVGNAFLDVCSRFNYWFYNKADKNDSGVVEFHVKSDFVDFKNLDMYDFEFVKTANQEGRLVFDRESLKAEDFTIRFIKKPNIESFDIKLDDKIKHFVCSFWASEYDDIFIFSRNNNDGKFVVYFMPKTFEDFRFLRLLNNVHLGANGSVSYKIEDIIQLMYDI